MFFFSGCCCFNRWVGFVTRFPCRRARGDGWLFFCANCMKNMFPAPPVLVEVDYQDPAVCV